MMKNRTIRVILPASSVYLGNADLYAVRKKASSSQRNNNDDLQNEQGFYAHWNVIFRLGTGAGVRFGGSLTGR